MNFGSCLQFSLFSTLATVDSVSFGSFRKNNDAGQAHQVRLGKILSQNFIPQDEVVNLWGDYARAWASAGIEGLRSGKYTDAVANFDTALRYDSEFAEAHHYKAIGLMGLGEFVKAVISINEVIRIDGHSPSILNNKAVCYMMLNQTSKAAEYFDMATSMSLTSEATLYLSNKNQLGRSSNNINLYNKYYKELKQLTNKYKKMKQAGKNSNENDLDMLIKINDGMIYQLKVMEQSSKIITGEDEVMIDEILSYIKNLSVPHHSDYSELNNIDEYGGIFNNALQNYQEDPDYNIFG
ncbi:MAG: hypothetical protein SFT91_05790 [Rickettsiaceae bacterium]|nr:hypothetical protein [Rickettsiaceae bacterium]